MAVKPNKDRFRTLLPSATSKLKFSRLARDIPMKLYTQGRLKMS